ncbi:MAG: tRNA (adenosine(37)-N6)-threonylcarbamoyltransferase complex dimerization subunit type 1 TsaB [Balneolales bacterium]|nr:tRNA (adenosine(37)-N6)-threonylcarbamoyltransferase complex dimerization subunit type 1 TsaB [Balneolales bacterium]
MNILSIESSTPVCSVALKTGNETFHRFVTGKGVHSEYVFIFCEELLKDSGLSFSQLNYLLIPSGPGSYTGLRIAASAAKGFLFENDKTKLKVYPTLMGIAQSAVNAENNSTGENRIVHAVLDARRSHLYYQKFRIDATGLLYKASESEIRELASIRKEINKEDVVCGTGINRLNLSDEYVKLENEAGISATNVIKLFDKSPENFTETDVVAFEPEY